MRINGEWLLGDDMVARPIIRGEVLRGDGVWWPLRLLIDTGADRTVLSAEVLRALSVDAKPWEHHVIGLGGAVDTVIVQTTLRLITEEGTNADLTGQFAAVTQPGLLDMSVLGRDVLDLFALIVDRPGEVICLLNQRHHYAIQQQP